MTDGVCIYKTLTIESAVFSVLYTAHAGYSIFAKSQAKR